MGLVILRLRIWRRRRISPLVGEEMCDGFLMLLLRFEGRIYLAWMALWVCFVCVSGMLRFLMSERDDDCLVCLEERFSAWYVSFLLC